MTLKRTPLHWYMGILQFCQSLMQDKPINLMILEQVNFVIDVVVTPDQVSPSVDLSLGLSHVFHFSCDI